MSARWDAADYARSSPAQQAWARELIAKLALRGDERVLDVGCGDGKVTADLAAAVPRGAVVGVDSSTAMVVFASGAFARVANLSFRETDASELPFDAEFDIVFSNAALHWIIDHRPVLRGIARALKSGGRALLQMGGAGNASGILAAIERVTSHGRWAPYFTGLAFPYGFYGPDEYRPWLAEAGLEPARVELIEKEMAYADANGLAGWFRTTWMPYTHRVPEDRRVQFVADVVDTYRQLHPPGADGRVHVAMVRLEVEARKSA